MRIDYVKNDSTLRTVVVSLTSRRGFTFQFMLPRFWSWNHGGDYRLIAPLGYYHRSFDTDKQAFEWAAEENLPLEKLQADGRWHLICL